MRSLSEPSNNFILKIERNIRLAQTSVSIGSRLIARCVIKKTTSRKRILRGVDDGLCELRPCHARMFCGEIRIGRFFQKQAARGKIDGTTSHENYSSLDLPCTLSFDWRIVFFARIKRVRTVYGVR